MNRRDIIIVAAVVNAALLLVICTTALKGKSAEEEMAAAPPVTLVEQAVTGPSMAAVPTPAGDEIDQVLKQFSAQQTTASPSGVVSPQDEGITSPIAKQLSVVEPSDAGSSFAQELQSPSFAAAPVTTEEAGPSYSEVVVKKGDSLDKIARAHNTTVNEVMKASAITSTRLKIGQLLKVPTSSSSRRSAKVMKEQSGHAAVRYYIVKKGDNPSTIAAKNHMKLAELLRLNNLDQESAHNLRPGQKLRIR